MRHGARLSTETKTLDSSLFKVSMTIEDFESLQPGDIVRSKELPDLDKCFRDAQDWEVIGPTDYDSSIFLLGPASGEGGGSLIEAGPHAGKKKVGWAKAELDYIVRRAGEAQEQGSSVVHGSFNDPQAQAAAWGKAEHQNHTSGFEFI